MTDTCAPVSSFQDFSCKVSIVLQVGEPDKETE
jgi:hypothetical protein